MKLIKRRKYPRLPLRKAKIEASFGDLITILFARDLRKDLRVISLTYRQFPFEDFFWQEFGEQQFMKRATQVSPLQNDLNQIICTIN